MQNAVSPRGWRRILFAIAALVAAIAAWLFAEHIVRTLSIFLIAAFIAFGLQPVVHLLEKRRVPKSAAISIVFGLLVIVIVLGLVVIVPLTMAQIQALSANVPAFVSTLQSWMSASETWLQNRLPGMQVPSKVFDVGTIGTSSLTSLATGTLTSLGTIVFGAATAFFVAFSAIVLSIFFLLNDVQISEGFASMFPESQRDTARQVASEITETFGKFIGGQVVVSAITGLVVAIISALIGFKFSLILGIITAIAYAIPVVGMLIAQAIAIVLCAPQGGWMVLWVQVIMFGMARISDNVLVPKIMGESVGVSPIGVMFAVFAGGELFGVPGLLLGIPAAALIKILWRYFVAPWLHAQLDSR